jgi:hypothetical protein
MDVIGKTMIAFRLDLALDALRRIAARQAWKEKT